MLGTVGVPKGEDGIVGKSIGLVDVLVQTTVAAIDILIYRRIDEGVVVRGMVESSRCHTSDASVTRVSKDLPDASVCRFFKAPSVLVAERATLTTKSLSSRISSLNSNHATTFRPAISGKLSFTLNFRQNPLYITF